MGGRSTSSWTVLHLLQLAMQWHSVSCRHQMIDHTGLAVDPANSLSQVAMTTSKLVEWMQSHSHEDLPASDYLAENAQLALRARSEIGPAATVPEEIFLREVVPFRQLDEPIDNWRGEFYEKLKPVAQGKATLREVADAVVPFVFTGLGRKVEFKGNNTPGVMAPVSQTLARGYASCTGLSILVSDALRAVGVPARVVGTPEWNLKSGGNHNWVEAWLGDGWHFMDAAPTKKVEWDNAWFTAKNTQLAEPKSIHGIFTPVFDKTEADSSYSFMWRDPVKQVPALDRTEAYKNLAKSSWNPAWEPYRAASENLR